MTILAFGLTIVFFALCGLHAYWSVGGRRGLDGVVPTVEGRRMLNPSRLASLCVAAALAVAGMVTLGATGAFQSFVAESWIRGALILLSVVFAARAVGDFRMIGITKRVRGTRFAKLDTLLFIPLCTVLALGCGVLAWFAFE